ncbi:hypothetical protein ACUODJ_59930, partial [Escherichia sp. HC-CC]
LTSLDSDMNHKYDSVHNIHGRYKNVTIHRAVFTYYQSFLNKFSSGILLMTCYGSVKVKKWGW